MSELKLTNKVTVLKSTLRDGGWTGHAIVRREQRNEEPNREGLPPLPSFIVSTKEALFEGADRDVVMLAAQKWVEEQAL